MNGNSGTFTTVRKPSVGSCLRIHGKRNDSLLRPVDLISTARGDDYHTSGTHLHCGETQALRSLRRRPEKPDKDIPSPRLASHFPSILHLILFLSC